MRLLQGFLPIKGHIQRTDSGLPLKCDMCEDDPPQEKPLCVQWCLNDALIYEERGRGSRRRSGDREVETGLKSMVDKYGLEKVMETVARMVEEGHKTLRRKKRIGKIMETLPLEPFKVVIDGIKEAGGEADKFCYQCGKCDTVCPWN